MSINQLISPLSTPSIQAISFRDLHNLRRENEVLQQVTNKYKQVAMNAESELRKLKSKLTGYTLNQEFSIKGNLKLLANRYYPYHINAKTRRF